MINVYEASTENVRELKKERRILEKLLKQAIRDNKEENIQLYKYLYALLYSSFAEVSFIKLINTPHGFNEVEIEDIMKCRNLEEKWIKCFELAFSKIENSNNLGEIANKKKTLKNILDEYIIAPSELRNKIAHGQWSVCLNNNCKDINNETSNRLKQLDAFTVKKEFEIYSLFEQCIEDLIESPLKAHPQQFYNRITEIETYIKDNSGRNFESYCDQIRNSYKTRLYKEKMEKIQDRKVSNPEVNAKTDDM